MSDLHVLHICNDFLGSNVYQELYQRLAGLGVKQTSFVPIRKSTEEKYEKLDQRELRYKLVGSNTINNYHKYFFELKRKFLFQDIVNKIDLQTVSFVHATTLFSDGVLALDIFKRYGIPYVVTVRSTDISTFLKYRPDLIGLALEIIKQSNQVIFITHALQRKFFLTKKIRLIKDLLLPKCVVIPNGINQEWIDSVKPKYNKRPFRIIYVGTFLRRKNVLRLAKAVLNLRNQFFDLQLTIVGGGGPIHLSRMGYHIFERMGT